MKLFKLTTLALLMSTGTIMAQQTEIVSPTASKTYNTAVGLRGFGTSGLTLKQFVGQSNAVEGIFNLWNRGFSATVLLERHVGAFEAEGLNWYYGGGGHVAVRSNDIYFRNGRDRYEYADGEVGLGVDGVFGIEYAIPQIPLAVSLDVKPFVEVTTSGNTWLGMDPGLGVKVTF